jgi:hypothetical protein
VIKMTSKEKLIINIAIIFLFAALIVGVMYLMPIHAFASAAKDTHHGSEETEAHVDEEHGQKEGHTVVQGHVEQPAHRTEAHEGKETHEKGPTHQTEGDGEVAAHGDEEHGEGTAHEGGHTEGGDVEEAAHGGGDGEVTAHGDGGHGEEAAHGGGHGEEGENGEGHGAESWWRFTGWQVVFAGIGCLYFALVLAWLPLLVAKKGHGGGH